MNGTTKPEGLDLVGYSLVCVHVRVCTWYMGVCAFAHTQVYV